MGRNAEEDILHRERLNSRLVVVYERHGPVRMKGIIIAGRNQERCLWMAVGSQSSQLIQIQIETQPCTSTTPQAFTSFLSPRLPTLSISYLSKHAQA